MTDFRTLSTPRPIAPGHLEFDAPDGWQLGRGSFGGLVVAVLVRAIETAEADAARPLRALTAELCGPLLPGPTEIRVEVLRRGTGMTTIAARLLQGGEVVAHGVGLLARARDDAAHDGMEPPAMSPWRDCPPLEGFGPPFARHVEFRPRGVLPFTSSPEARAEGWVRLRAPGSARDAALLAALADATWPSLFARMSEPRVLSTVSYTLQIVGTLEGLDPEAPLYHRGRALASRDGFTAELRELWGEDGRLVALNQQTFATVR